MADFRFQKNIRSAMCHVIFGTGTPAGKNFELLSKLPTYLMFFFPTASYLLIIRLLRVLRIFRIPKLLRYLGEAIIAVPTGIFTAELSAEIGRSRDMTICNNCARHDHDANCCKLCGNNLDTSRQSKNNDSAAERMAYTLHYRQHAFDGQDKAT